MIFQVVGRGPFPIDMLRYDRCSPASECDSQQINKTFQRGSFAHGERVVVNLFRPDRLDQTPCSGRWASFGWPVVPAGQEAPFTC